jgi:hypothetical protein
LRERLERALADAAERAGVTPEDLEELATPTHGLDAGGVARRSVGDHTAEFQVEGTAVQVRWVTPDGRRRKTVPVGVRRAAPEEVKRVRADARELRDALQAQRHRLERLLAAGHRWQGGAWRERVLDHALTGLLARRLLWRVDGETVGWWEGRLVTRAGVERSVADDAEIGLWHPIDEGREAVLGWRAWLEERLVTQPFKQAHREVYLLTDAERETGSYSNRFAGHIVRQHQLHALCQERGWRYTLQGAWDSYNVPVHDLPHGDLAVELIVEPVEIEAEQGETGVFLYVTTDQVRFTVGGEPMPLADVPPLDFSEAMRDVDLFVGVASVATDPAWRDRGELGATGTDYWTRAAFGELSATAQTRREVLERLVPRLAIADRCSFDDRHLVVRGDLHTYRIHLGSGNVLMEPGSEYLCIVRAPEKRGSGTAFLPFEGDRMLSIVLSKAFLLADDRAIDDPAITSQL